TLSLLDALPIYYVLRGAFALPGPPASESLSDPFFRVLLLRPIWPGFAINTIFYAAILWLLFVAPFKLRRWRRIKRNHCVKCNYDLRGTTHQRCPECGTPVTHP